MSVRIATRPIMTSKSRYSRVTKYNAKYCIVYGCLNKSQKCQELSFFTLPHDNEKLRKWLHVVDREDLLQRENFKPKSYYVCESHFEQSAINLKAIKLLKDDAMPTLCLPNTLQEHKCDPDTTRSNNESKNTAATQTHSETELSSVESQTKSNNQSEESQKKRKLETDPLDCNEKLTQMKQEVIEVDEDLKFSDDTTRRFKKLISLHNKIESKLDKNHCDGEYKLFALNLHYSNSNAYQCLRAVLQLPIQNKLNRFKIRIPPQLNNRDLNSLSLKIKSLPVKEKHFTICIDKIPLKRNLYYDIKNDEMIGFQNTNGRVTPKIATNAYVIVLQSMYTNWKQPIAYAFLTSIKHYSPLDLWINDTIRKLIQEGIVVKAIISNQEKYFDEYAKVVKKVTVDKPYFFIDGHKIYYLFDVPSLLTSLRDHLISSDFILNGNIISWDHITGLYELQKETHQQDLRLISKITQVHIIPNNLQRKEVKYAAQIFSSTMSAALNTYIDFGEIAEEARATVEFIKTIDNTFDVLNSTKIKSEKSLKSAYGMSAEQQQILKEAQYIFANIKSTDENDEIKTFINFQITIQVIVQLFQDLKEVGIQKLYTRNLNRDAIDIIFRSVKSESCFKPTAIQFTRTFSKLFKTHMLKNSPSTRCDLDIFQMLQTADDILESQRKSQSEAQPSLVTLNGEIDYRINLPIANSLTYVASFLMFKCSTLHNDCKKTVEAFKSAQRLDHNRTSHYREYNKNAAFYGSLRITTADFNKYVEKLETVFVQNFEVCINGRLGSTIFELLKEIPSPSLPCSCFPIDYLLRLFVRLRIYSTLKFNNHIIMKMDDISETRYLKVKQLSL